MQLGHRDNDPVVLLARVVAAVERTGPVRGELLEELSQRTPRINQVALPLLAADFGERDPFVLVLDDVDVVTARKSRAILGFVVDWVRSGSQLVLIARGDPGVPLGRLRASGDLVEIGAALLALDAQETRDVAASGGLELSEEAAEALRERTEGWAAAVALATLSLRGRDDADMRAAGQSGNQEQIADYLVEEVLKRQPEPLKRFLLGTSILERMTAPLCDVVLGTDDAAISLEALARSNAFVVPLDDHREWYRYHHLFSDILRAELEWRHPELLRVYLRRAAGWVRGARNPGRGVRIRTWQRRSRSGRPNRARVSGLICTARAERDRAALARALHRGGDRVRPPAVDRGRVGLPLSRRRGPGETVRRCGPAGGA